MRLPFLLLADFRSQSARHSANKLAFLLFQNHNCSDKLGVKEQQLALAGIPGVSQSTGQRP
jgi:hypothetical protein